MPATLQLLTPAHATFHKFAGKFGVDFRSLSDSDPGHWTIQLSADGSFVHHPIFSTIQDFLQEGGRRPGQALLCDWHFQIDPICREKEDGKQGYHQDTSFTALSFDDGILTIKTERLGASWEKTGRLFLGVIRTEFICAEETSIAINLNLLRGTMKYHK